LDYLGLGRARSIAKLSAAVGEFVGRASVSRRHLERWSSLHGWVERAKNYDSDQLLEKIAGRKEIQEDTRQDAVDASKRAMDAVIRILDGTMPEGDKQIVCDRSGKPQTTTIEGAFGVPLEVAITKPMVSPRDRLKAAELALGIAGIVVVKKTEQTISATTDVRLGIRSAVSALDPEVKASLAGALGIDIGDTDE